MALTVRPSAQATDASHLRPRRWHLSPVSPACTSRGRKR
uniref:Uncharacterized protein n=1 Tax=Siphoviridae sp. ctHSY3 TaxID=2825421 RepID=A0A8S5TV05_9CAUD|nr:MAG TPA: hypothetical protein [Siphoviridae sp. ctHSY3]